jgi:dynein heavy chain
MLHTPPCKPPTLQEFVQQLLARRYAKQKAPVRDLTRLTAGATLDIFEYVCEQLLPIRSKLHYVFDRRNLIRFVKCMVVVQPQTVKTDISLMLLWDNDLMREFHDRFGSVRDRKWYLGLLPNTESRRANMQVIGTIGA